MVRPWEWLWAGAQPGIKHRPEFIRPAFSKGYGDVSGFVLLEGCQDDADFI